MDPCALIMAPARALMSRTGVPALTGMGGSRSGSNFCEALPFPNGGSSLLPGTSHTQSPGRHRGSIKGVSQALFHRTGSRLNNPPVCACLSLRSESLTRFGCEAVSFDKDLTVSALGSDAFPVMTTLKCTWLCSGALPWSTSNILLCL